MNIPHNVNLRCTCGTDLEYGTTYADGGATMVYVKPCRACTYADAIDEAVAKERARCVALCDDAREKLQKAKKAQGAGAVTLLKKAIREGVVA